VKHAVAGDAGVVDQNLDRPKFRLDLLHAGRGGVRISHVPLVGRDAGLGLELVGGGVIAMIDGGDRVARVLEPLGDRRPDAAGTTGDDGDFRHVIPPVSFPFFRRV
jgi:hypothetical protein